MAQDRTYEYHAGFNVLRGFLQPHNSEVAHLTYGRPTGIELQINRRTIGKEAWEIRYGEPETGFSITYFNTDMEPTGSLISGIAFMEFFLVKSRIGSMTFRVGTGLTYATKVYDKETNNLNNVISSRLTYNMQGRFGFYFPLGERLLLNPSFTFTHASNGSLKLPNAGINIVSANLGLTYQFHSTDIPEQPLEEAMLDRSVHYNLQFSGSVKEIYPTGGPKYGYFTLRGYADKPLNRVSRLTAGIDFFMNRALIEQIRRNEAGPIDYKRASILIGHELVISNVSVMTEIGYYFYRPFKGGDDPNVYQRYGLKYYFTETLFASAMLKTFIGRADTFDFGIGVRL